MFVEATANTDASTTDPSSLESVTSMPVVIPVSPGSSSSPSSSKMARATRRFGSLWHHVTEAYTNALLKQPLIVFVLYFGLSGFMTFCALKYHAKELSLDARAGFETRGTQLSYERLALRHVLDNVASRREILMGDRGQNRTKREVEATTLEPITVNYDEYGVDDGNEKPEVKSPCEVYQGLGGKHLSYNVIDGLGKAIFEIDSFDHLFTLPVIKKLCKLDSILEDVVEKTKLKDFMSPVPWSFHLPYYVYCTNMSYIHNCDDLTQDYVNRFRDLVSICMSPDQDEEDVLNCNTSIAIQVRDYILQKQPYPGYIPTGKIYIGSVIKIWNAYVMDTTADNAFLFYSTLLDTLETFYDGSDGIKLRGLFVGAQEFFFKSSLMADIILGGVALIPVVLGIFFYSKSFIFTIVILAGMLLAIGAACFVYSVVLGISFFPFINLLVVVIAIAVGADDAFLLSYQFQKHKSELKLKNSKLLTFDSDSPPKCDADGYSYKFHGLPEDKEFLSSNTELVRNATRAALGHAGAAMFVTSATTAVAFLTNCFSSILILRCFGIFAAITMLTNYIFVITALPAILIILHDREKCHTGIAPPSASTICAIPGNIIAFIRRVYVYKLPLYVYKIYPFVVAIATFCFIGATIALVWRPGIKLPENNAMQLLRSHHPFEWFEEYHRQFFNFTGRRSYMLNFYALWGVRPTIDASPIILSDTGHLATKIGTLTLKDLKDTVTNMKSIATANFVKTPLNSTTHTLWLERFLKWSSNCETAGTCCLQNDSTPINLSCFQTYVKAEVDYAKPNGNIIHRLADGPIFEKESHRLLGFFVQGPTKTPFSNFYDDLNPLFTQFSKIEKSISTDAMNDMLISSPDITNLFDLLSSLLNGTLLSVVVSVGVSAVVIVLSTRRALLSLAAVVSIALAIVCIAATLLLVGWTINVVEGTILVISIGLSFDYTLHMAVAYKLASDIVVTEKLREANEACGIPIALAGLTNAAAGLILIAAKTQAFFEIGVFLIVMTVISFLTSHFVFVSLVYLFSRFPRERRI
uniref:SSD domain-containing protein n=1 Tax=Panagrellus redivivus TaxID=6233 RepID=A0A7E4VIR0_PANRE